MKLRKLNDNKKTSSFDGVKTIKRIYKNRLLIAIAN